MPSKKKSVDEARARLQEKLNDVKSKSDSLHTLIDNISQGVSRHYVYYTVWLKCIKFTYINQLNIFMYQVILFY